MGVSIKAENDGCGVAWPHSSCNASQLPHFLVVGLVDNKIFARCSTSLSCAETGNFIRFTSCHCTIEQLMELGSYPVIPSPYVLQLKRYLNDEICINLNLFVYVAFYTYIRTYVRRYVCIESYIHTYYTYIYLKSDRQTDRKLKIGKIIILTKK